MIQKVSQIGLWGFLILVQVQLLFMYNGPKDAVVDVEKVFVEFEMKKELEQQLRQIEQRQKTTLDSLELGLKILERDFQNAANEKEQEKIQRVYEQSRALYQRRKSIMDEEVRRVVANFDEQIWNQLKAYLEDFGKQNDYRLVLGDYQKNIIYNDNELNCTDQAIQYINSKYQGN